MSDASAPPPAAPRAIFVSYSHDDAIAARRIAATLRDAGLEVWFDENELRSGDVWDAKIKQQIRDCTLFLPVISQNTQRRREGYFRLEWHLAEERSRLIARGTPFIVPVAVDDVAERGALVPEVFLSVQWTRLRNGEASAAFGERVKQLLAGENEGPDTDRATTPRAGLPPQVGRRVPAAVWVGLVAACAIAVAGFLALRPSTDAGAATRPPAAEKTVAAAPSPLVPAGPRLGPKSIAVLPFDNLSEDKDANAFFAVGMHEDVISSLYLIPELRPIPRATVMTYLGTKKTPREIADELGVAFLLNGTVRRAGETVRMTATLFNPRTEETLWNKPYNRDVKDIFAIQAELAQAIATEMKTLISPETKKLLERPPTENLAAYDSFLKSRDLRRRGIAALPGVRSPIQKLLQAQESLLQAAVTLDPKFALAWAELAWVHSVAYNGYISTWRDRTPARRDKAKLAIENAVRLAPDEAEVILNSGYYHQFCERNYFRAATEFERVARLLPNSPGPSVALAQLFRSQGRWLEALASIQKATRLDPSDSVAGSDHLVLLTAGRRFEESMVELERLSRVFPEVYDFSKARLPFNARGSTREVEQYLDSLPEGNRAKALRWRWSNQHGNYLQPIDPKEVLSVKDVSTSDSWEFEIQLAVQRAAHGELAEARRRLVNAPANLRARLELEPSNTSLLCDLACIEALLGRPEEAMRAVRAAMEITPTEFDRWQGPQIEENLAFVYAWTGDKTNAVATYARLLRSPCVSPRLAGMNVHTMRHSLWFAPLREDPRWEALLNDPKNNAPLF